LRDKTGEPVEVFPLVVLPGWFVKIPVKGNFRVFYGERKLFTGIFRAEGQKISVENIAALDEKCRDMILIQNYRFGRHHMKFCEFAPEFCGNSIESVNNSLKIELSDIFRHFLGTEMVFHVIFSGNFDLGNSKCGFSDLSHTNIRGNVWKI